MGGATATCNDTSKTSDICDHILENLPFGHKQTFKKTQLKIFTIILKLTSFAHLDKATMKPSCYKVSHQKLLFLGDMDDYIRLTSVPKR